MIDLSRKTGYATAYRNSIQNKIVDNLFTAPWFKVLKAQRINDHHLTLAEKRKARETAKHKS